MVKVKVEFGVWGQLHIHLVHSGTELGTSQRLRNARLFLAEGWVACSALLEFGCTAQWLSFTCIYVSALPHSPFLYGLSQDTHWLYSLCCAAGPCWLQSLHMTVCTCWAEKSPTVIIPPPSLFPFGSHWFVFCIPQHISWVNEWRVDGYLDR